MREGEERERLREETSACLHSSERAPRLWSCGTAGRGGGGALRANPSRCATVVITTPSASCRISRSDISRSTVTRYHLACPCRAPSSVFGSRPSLVRRIKPVLSLSSLPTGNTRISRGQSIASRIFPQIRRSVVQVTPRGFLRGRGDRPRSILPCRLCSKCSVRLQGSNCGVRLRTSSPVLQVQEPLFQRQSGPLCG